MQNSLIQANMRKAVFLIRSLAFCLSNQTNLYQQFLFHLHVYTHVKLQQPYELTVTYTRFLELGKPRLREVKKICQGTIC